MHPPSPSSRSMSPRTVTSSRHAIENCIFKLHTWKPFHLPTTFTTKTPQKSDTLNNNNNNNNNPTPPPSSKPHKRPCLSDRKTTSFSIENLDITKLQLSDNCSCSRSSVKSRRCERINILARKRRRRGSRSVSGRSSDGTRRRCCSIGGGGSNAYAYGTCSDFMMANNGGTDSSGELFVNNNNGGEVNWGSDVANLRRESNERESCSNNNNSSSGVQQHCYYYGSLDNGNVNNNNNNQGGNESGYGSEPGYRGDAEFGYGDEFDEEEDDNTRVLFWGNKFGDGLNMETIGENTLAKAHHRCRRKKHELRMIDAV